MSRLHGALGTLGVLAAAIATAGAAQSPTTAISLPLGGTAANAPACSGVNAKGLPNCSGAVLFGAATNLAGSRMTTLELYRDAESRYGRSIPVWRLYAVPGTLPLQPGLAVTQAALAHLSEGGIVQYNWKVNRDWSKATGRDGATNAAIDAAAGNIKAVAPGIVMLTLHHEPDDDIGGGTTCATKGTNPRNTPANYVALWRNVHDRFVALGVTNVTWVTGYMGFRNHECARNSMWPGDDIVDVVGFDKYWGAKAYRTIASSVGATYNWFLNNSAPGHNYAAKPFALMETGMNQPTVPQEVAYQGYRDLATAIASGTYPNLKLVVPWDSNGDNGKSVRVDMAGFNTPDPVEQAEFNRFASTPNLMTSPTVVR